MQPDRTALWPRFANPVRSTALTARLGRLLGISIGICFVTGQRATASTIRGAGCPCPRGRSGATASPEVSM